MVGHDDEGVEFVEAFGAVMLQGFEEELGVAFDLEEAAAVVGDCSEEECSGVGGSWRDGHGWSLFDLGFMRRPRFSLRVASRKTRGWGVRSIN